MRLFQVASRNRRQLTPQDMHDLINRMPVEVSRV